jgi:hypothetical protein
VIIAGREAAGDRLDPVLGRGKANLHLQRLDPVAVGILDKDMKPVEPCTPRREPERGRHAGDGGLSLDGRLAVPMVVVVIMPVAMMMGMIAMMVMMMTTSTRRGHYQKKFLFFSSSACFFPRFL